MSSIDSNHSFVDPVAYDGILPNIQNLREDSEPKQCFNVFDEEHHNEEEHANRKQSLWRSTLHIIRPGHILNHLDYESFKIAFRTWVQIWSTVILIIVPKTVNWIGFAPYLMQIFGFITALGDLLIIHASYISITSFFYLMVAWLNITIALAITSKLRGWKSPDDLMKLLISDGSCTEENIQSCMLDQVATGRFLETRCTVIFIFSIMFGVVIFGVTMSHNMTLRPAYVSGIIATVALSSSYVGYPVFSPKEIGYQIVKPLSITIAVRIVASILIFPTTSSFLYLNGTQKILRALRGTMRKNTSLMKTLRPSAPGFTNYSRLSEEIIGSKNKIAMFEFLASTIRFEFSFGRFDAGDIGEFRVQLKNLITLGASYEYFYQLLHERKDVVTEDYKAFNRKQSVSSSNAANSTGHSKLFTALQDSYKPVGQFEDKRRIHLLEGRINSFDSENNLTLLDLDDISTFISMHFISILDAINVSLESIENWVDAANSFRSYSIIIPKRYSEHKKRQKQHADDILRAREILVKEIEKYDDFKFLESIMRDKTRNEEALLCLISQSSLLLNISKDYCKGIMRIIDLFISIDETRPTPKFISWFTTLQRDRPQHINSVLSVGDSNESSSSFWQSTVSFRDADALPPSRLYHFIGRKAISLASLLLDKHFLFWLRVAGYMVISFIPNFCRTTAGWYYANRLFWIPLMCAVTVSEYLGETVYGTLVRIVYLFIGGVIGMVAWYISTGNGTGNYYGFGVVTGIMYFPLSYYRHFSVHQTFIPCILLCVTVALVMGTSWEDAQYPQELVLLGYGFSAAWKRLVSVTIGVALSCLTNLFPKVMTSKVIVRKILAQALERTGNMHCDISRFAYMRINNPSHHILLRHDPILEKYRTVLIKLASITKIMGPIKYEVPIRGDWPRLKYEKLQALITDVIQLYLMLHTALDGLQDPQHWGPIIIDRVGWTDVSMNADVFSILHMASGSLKSKIPLPKITQANLSLKHLDLLRSQWGLERLSLSERFYGEESSETEEKECVIENDSLHKSIVKNLDYSKLLSSDGQYNIMALLCAHMIYKRLDQIIITVKSLVGEVYDYELAMFSDEYQSLIS